MPNKLDLIHPNRKSGNEQFHVDGKPLNFNILNFWQWSNSDLLSNTARGVIAEYLVASVIGINEGIREAWAPYDLETSDGIKIEVKSSAYIQQWHQSKLSKISFSIAPARAWNPETNQLENNRIRHSDIYIFCLFAHKDQSTIDPLNISQWEFYLIPTSTLNGLLPAQKSITLSRLKSMNPVSIAYNNIPNSIHQLIHST